MIVVIVIIVIMILIILVIMKMIIIIINSNNSDISDNNESHFDRMRSEQTGQGVPIPRRIGPRQATCRRAEASPEVRPPVQTITVPKSGTGALSAANYMSSLIL